MIVQIAPVEKNVGETLASLNFAQRVRTVELGAASKHIENGDAKTNGEVDVLVNMVYSQLISQEYSQYGIPIANISGTFLWKTLNTIMI